MRIFRESHRQLEHITSASPRGRSIKMSKLKAHWVITCLLLLIYLHRAFYEQPNHDTKRWRLWMLRCWWTFCTSSSFRRNCRFISICSFYYNIASVVTAKALVCRIKKIIVGKLLRWIIHFRICCYWKNNQCFNSCFPVLHKENCSS